jgi:poly-gamma-glutamate capsule biosynthesis protein CapA/YwtB (metallophosphatase superfamily)
MDAAARERSDRVMNVKFFSLRPKSSLLATLLCAAVAGKTGAQTPGTPDPNAQLLKTPIAPSLRGAFSLAAVGDLLGPGQPVMALKDQDFEKVVRLIQSSDVATANDEGAIFDIRKFEGTAAAQNGGGDPLDDPGVAKDLKAMGFTVINKANNHAFDFGLEGLDATNKSLEDAGLLHVGSGRNLAEARAAVYVETPHGRIAFVGAASTFNPASPAAAPEAELRGRPGISVLRTDRVILVTQDEMTQLRQMAAARGAAPRGNGKNLFLFGERYRVADKPGLTYEMDPFDESEILKSVRGAKQISDLAVFTIHAHETASGSADDPAPGDFLPIFYHRLIDAGADVVLTHGQHVLRGIEIYKGRPIFYGLGSFFDDLELDRAPPQHETFLKMGLNPDEVTYSEYLNIRFKGGAIPGLESVVAITDFDGDHLKQVRLYPILLNRPGHQLGIPYLAPPEQARKILQNLIDMSAQFGTHIDIEGSVGIIRLPASAKNNP